MANAFHDRWKNVRLGPGPLVENPRGAGGMLAAEAVAKAPAVDYTLLGNIKPQ